MTLIKLWPRLAQTILGLGLITGRAYAEDGSPLARRYFEQATQAFSEGHYREAIDLFRRADRESSRAELEYNIGVAYEEMGNVAGALEAYRSYLRRAPNSPDRAQVEGYVERLERQLAKQGVQQVSVRTEPEGATVFVDGAPVGLAPWTGELEHGRHQLVVRLCGYREIESVLDVSLEHALDTDLALRSLNIPSATSNATLAGRSLGDKKATGLATIEPVTWTLLGVGVVSLAGAGYFELSRASADRAARHAVDPIAQARDRGHADARQTTSLILLGAGASAIAAGGLFVYLDLKRAGHSNNTAVAVGCDALGCGLNAARSF